MQFFHDTKIDFIKMRTFFFVLSTILNVIGIIATLMIGVEYGIDFKGGTEIVTQFTRQISTQQIRKIIEDEGIKGAEIKTYGKENQYLIRVKEAPEAAQHIIDGLKNKLSDNSVTIIGTNKIGAKIGDEMKHGAYLAVFLSVIAILLYIAFRFEFVWGLGAIIALIHDVIITFTFIVMVNATGWIELEMNQTLLAALLTVIGFSVNDTVIIFDRIRENKVKMKGISFIKLVNTSINETLSRTINTVFTVVLVLLALVLLGGPVLQGFAFTMLIGIITGTYSSIYIASSYVIWHMEKVQKISFEDAPTKKEQLKTIKA